MSFIRFLAVWLFLAGFAQAKGGAEQGLLFELTRQSLPPVYLFGTIHSGEPEVLAFVNSVKPYQSRASCFVMEVEPEALSALSMLSGFWLTDGSTLQSVVGEKMYNQVMKKAKILHIPESSFTYMKPWAVTLMFSMPKQTGVKILDLEIHAQAVSLGQSISGLESMQEQLSVFDSLSLKEQIQLLKTTLDNVDNLDEQYGRLLTAYLTKDLSKLMEIGQQTATSSVAEAKLMEKLLDNRNQLMFERLQPLIRQDVCFVALGALHLPGDTGLLRLFERAGYVIRKLL